MGEIPYSVLLRQAYIQQNLFDLYGWDEATLTKADGWSYRQIAGDISVVFDRKAPGPATIKTDIDVIRRIIRMPEGGRHDELLIPDQFRKWRSTLFTDPATGLPYETPDHQYHWFRAIIAFALKEAIPQETLDYLELNEDQIGIDLNEMIEGRVHLLTLILLAPPRHGKTELGIHCIIWLICYNPNIRILYCSGIKSTSARNIDLVKSELEENAELIRRYGPFRGDRHKWNNDEFTVSTRTRTAKAPTGTPIGKGSNIRSLDADLIFLDDPQDLRDAESEATTTADYRWTTTELFTRREPHTPVIGLGSHLPTLFGDVWTQIEENIDNLNTGRQVVVIKKVKAHDYKLCNLLSDPEHTQCVLWHSLRPYWYLEAQRANIGDDVLFEAVYNQELLEGALRYFPKEIVRAEYWTPSNTDGPYPDLAVGQPPGILDYGRSWRDVPTCCNTNDPLAVALGVDPGASEKQSGSESAFFLLGGCRHCGRRYPIDFEHLRQSPEINPHTIIGFAESYTGDLQRVRVEYNAYQKALARDPIIVNAQGRLKYLIDEWNTDDRKNDPLMGIPNLSRHMKIGKFSLPMRHESDQVISEYFIRQLIRWPKRPNDVVMALWLADLSVAEMLEDMKYATPELGPDQGSLSQHLRDQQYEIDLSEVTLE